MKYALLTYSRAESANAGRNQALPAGVAAVVERPNVSGWIRLERPASAHTVRPPANDLPVTDGPFVDSKEFLAGLILIDVETLDAALAIARELQRLDITAAIEVRPVFEQELGGA